MRQGLRPSCEIPSAPPGYIPSEELNDLFTLINRIILKAEIPKNIFCIHSRTNFVLNFVSILINGATPFHVEPFSRTGQTIQKDPFSRTQPLLSQKVFHIDYITALKEEEQLLAIKPETK